MKRKTDKGRGSPYPTIWCVFQYDRGWCEKRLGVGPVLYCVCRTKARALWEAKRARQVSKGIKYLGFFVDRWAMIG